jgi:hypothetical protein
VRYALAVTLLALSALHVAEPAAAEVSAGREVSVTGERTKQQFIAGYRVHIGANVTDDVFAVGRDATIEGARARMVVTGADRIVVKDSVLHDLFAGGQDIEIQGTIEDDAMVAVCPVCPWDWGRRDGLATTRIWLRAPCGLPANDPADAGSRGHSNRARERLLPLDCGSVT